MKKLTSVLCIFLVAAMAFCLVSCNLIQLPILGGNFGNNDGNNNYNNVSRIDTNVKDYNVDDTSSAVEKAAAISMTATYELTCEIEYSYKAYSMGFGFSQGGWRNVTSSTKSQGTGFVIDEQGYMVTNAHVINVENSDQLNDFAITNRTVYAARADVEEKLQCQIVAYNEKTDLALLKIVKTSQADTFNFLPFFNYVERQSAKSGDLVLNYGEQVLAVGNANGYGISITTGVVSAPLRQFASGDGSITKAIQIDAAINPGNSGGPLVNLFAAVVGVNSFKVVQTNTENMGYAIPGYVVTAFLDGLKNGNFAADTQSSTHGVAFSGTCDVSYYLANSRAYKVDGSNLIKK